MGTQWGPVGPALLCEGSRSLWVCSIYPRALSRQGWLKFPGPAPTVQSLHHQLSSRSLPHSSRQPQEGGVQVMENHLGSWVTPVVSQPWGSPQCGTAAGFLSVEWLFSGCTWAWGCRCLILGEEPFFLPAPQCSNWFTSRPPQVTHNCQEVQVTQHQLINEWRN